ncbi:hypothetical protein C8J57DRAFT_247667 [Mycena rebaudengoi]|nr:hypothetical protein C8J57DRAFT_247667 [Mycena rebaudengoi]
MCHAHGPFATNTTRICTAAACSPPRLARARGLRLGPSRKPMPALEDCPPYRHRHTLRTTRAPDRYSSFVLTTIVRPTTKSFTGFFSRFLCAPAAPTGVWNTVLKKSGEICLPGRGWELRQWRRLRARLCPSRRRDLLVSGRGHYPRGRALDGSFVGGRVGEKCCVARFRGTADLIVVAPSSCCARAVVTPFSVVEAARRRLSSLSGPPPDNLFVRPAGRDSEGGRPLEETGHTSRDSASAISHKRFRTSCFSLTRRCLTMRYVGVRRQPEQHGGELQRIGRQDGDSISRLFPCVRLGVSGDDASFAWASGGILGDCDALI